MRIIACDDDANMLFMIKKWMKELFGGKPYHFVSYENGLDLLNEMQRYEGDEPQIIFMDIKLKNDNGIGIAKILNQNYGNVAVIFISGYTEYFEDSFEADPVYFLIKPIKKDNFQKAVEKAVKKLSERAGRYLLITGKELKRIFYDDIIYAESVGRKIRLWLKDGVMEYYEKMDALEEQLGEDFVRCHKSFLVNMGKVRSVEAKEIILLNDVKIPISRKKSNEAKEKIFWYLGRQI